MSDQESNIGTGQVLIVILETRKHYELSLKLNFRLCDALDCQDSESEQLFRDQHHGSVPEKPGIQM